MAPLASTEGMPPDDSIGWQLWVGVLTTAIPATIAVALRFYARIKGKLPLRADDWLIVGSLASVWIMAGLRFSQVINYDLGRRTVYVEDWQVREFKRSFMATQIFYFTAATCTRCSILFFYRRIFIAKTFRILVWIVMSLVIGYFVSCTLAALFGCQPVSYFWNTDQPGRCMNEFLFFKVNGILNLILDIVVLLLPLPMLWRLQMHIKKKVALSMIFSLGLFACLCSSFRLVQYRNPKWKNHEDPMRTFLHSSVWSSIEQNVGVICACLPCLRLLLRPSANWGPVSGELTADYTERPHVPSGRFSRGHPQAESIVREKTGNDLALAMEMSKTESSGVSTKGTAHSDSDAEKSSSEIREKDSIWRTQEVYQSSANSGERYT